MVGTQQMLAFMLGASISFILLVSMYQAVGDCSVS